MCVRGHCCTKQWLALLLYVCPAPVPRQPLLLRCCGRRSVTEYFIMVRKSEIQLADITISPSVGRHNHSLFTGHELKCCCWIYLLYITFVIMYIEHLVKNITQKAAHALDNSTTLTPALSLIIETWGISGQWMPHSVTAVSVTVHSVVVYFYMNDVFGHGPL